MKKETKNEKSMFRMSIVKRIIAVAILLMMASFALSFADVRKPALENENLLDASISIESIQNDTIQLCIELPHESIKKQMVDEVDKYMSKSTRGKHDKQLAELLVENSLKHQIDICFMMGQAKIETLFGTAGAGRASSRRSLFGIIKKKWLSYDDAINDYCLLLKKSYLAKGKTEHDLMKNYATVSGNRYAGSLAYESDLRKAYNDICKATSLKELQKQYFIEHSKFLALDSSSASDSTEVGSAENS